MKKNKSLEFLFNKIYNDGKLIRLTVAKSKIKALNDFYKKNFESTENYESFILKLGGLLDSLKKSKSAMAEFEKQFNRKMALQPAILNECFVAQTLANVLNLNKFIDADEKRENVPSELFEALIRSKGGNLEPAMPRYIYFSNKKGVVLLQYGDSSSIDAVFVKDGYRVRLEIKEEKAKLGEYDLNYDEAGKLIPTPNILQGHIDYLKFINIFNSKTNVFDYMGRNFKIGEYLDSELLINIVGTVFDLKKIDLYILQNKETIFSVPTKNLLSCVDVNTGSEIRTAGRNHYQVFTPNKLIEYIKLYGGNIVDGIVVLPYLNKNESKARGKSTISRYKINSLFFVKYEDVTIDGPLISFSLNKVRQNKATISIHLYSKINKDALSDSHLYLNHK